MKKIWIKDFDLTEITEYLPKKTELVSNFNEISLGRDNNFVFHPYSISNDTPIYVAEIEKETTFAPTINNSFYFPTSGKTISKSNYINQIEKAKEQLQISNSQKVVISRYLDFNFSFSNEMKRIFFSSLCLNYPNAFCFMVELSDNEFWVGATPEKLLNLKPNLNFTIDSLAGTISEKDYLSKAWTNKEFDEQSFVTQHISSQLKELQIEYKLGNTKPVKAGNLYHLKTEIKGKLNSTNQLHKLITSLHPTPAVCGLPVENAKKIITRVENYNRSYYTGFLGFIHQNFTTQLVVNLRSLQVKNKTTRLYAGGGITSDSNPENEWLETENKFQTLLSILHQNNATFQ